MDGNKGNNANNENIGNIGNIRRVIAVSYTHLDVYKRQYLSPTEIEEIFDYSYHTKNVDYIFHRAGLD